MLTCVNIVFRNFFVENCFIAKSQVKSIVNMNDMPPNSECVAFPFFNEIINCVLWREDASVVEPGTLKFSENGKKKLVKK